MWGVFGREEREDRLGKASDWNTEGELQGEVGRLGGLGREKVQALESYKQMRQSEKSSSSTRKQNGRKGNGNTEILKNQKFYFSREDKLRNTL